jgi:hypothetical protein
MKNEVYFLADFMPGAKWVNPAGTANFVGLKWVAWRFFEFP